MNFVQEAIDRVFDYLGDRMSLEEFEDWSALYIQNAYRSDNSEARHAAALVRSILNAFDDDALENGLRQELADAIYPFVHMASNRSGEASSSAESNASLDELTVAA